jgi:hypothetical protein
MMRCALLISIVAQSVCIEPDLAVGDAPQQTGTVQVTQRARWMTSKTGAEHPNSTPGAVVWLALPLCTGREWS